MILGVYNTYISAISIVNMSVIFPMIIGIIIGSFVLMKIVKVLLTNFHSQTMFGIIGFSIGSLLVLYPNYSFNIESLISIILLFLGFIIGKNIK